MKIRLLLTLAVVTSILLQPVAAPSVRAQIFFTDQVTAANKYEINYTNDDSEDKHFFSTAQAQRMANALSNNNEASPGNPNGYHDGYVNLGFVVPPFNIFGTRPTHVFDCVVVKGCDSGQAWPDRIVMPAPKYRDESEPCMRTVLGHELFHHVEFGYIGYGVHVAFGKAAIEGAARVMQDKIFSDLDADAGCITYRHEIKKWLKKPDQNLWEASYKFALFWNYLMEQLGEVRTEPQVGVDFMERFWDKAQRVNLNWTEGAPIDFVRTLRETIAEFSTARTLERLFEDFAIANYTKQMNVSALPNSQRYRYVDENTPSAVPYRKVARFIDAPLDATPIITRVGVSMWGNEYYVVRPSGACMNGKSNVISFLATGDVMNWALVSATGSASVQRIDRGAGASFARSLLQRAAAPFTEVAAIAVNTGVGQPAESPLTEANRLLGNGGVRRARATVSFSCGEASVQIREPRAGSPVYVGDKAAPDRFMLRVIATSSITLASNRIEGLLPSDFEVFVGNVMTTVNKATVVSGAYVQGEYWLVVQPPPKGPTAAAKQYVTVRLNTATDTKGDAVIYEKKILDQMLVIDRSESMKFPTSAPKLPAAKNGARLFVDVARASDRLGLVTFSGNATEPNDDAVLEMSLITVTSASRVTATNKINGISASGLTSIGDGVEKARLQFASGGPGEDWIVLLSDGKENEARLWSSVAPSITNAGIRVNTIAFGPYADQALLQQIANQTGGVYYYVNAGSTAAAARAAAESTESAESAETEGTENFEGSADAVDSAAGATAIDAIDTSADPTANLLADAYALANERQRGHQRVGEWWGSVNKTVFSTTFKIDAGGLRDALFSLNWPDNVGVLTMTLQRPNGTLVQSGNAGVSILSRGTHIVIAMDAAPGGTWTLNVSGGTSAAPFVALMSGVPQNGVETRLWLGQQPLGSGPLSGLYLRGLPMPVLASLSDRAGPIRNARVVASVRHPSGGVMKLPLFDDGNHSDGAAGDGVFGNLYARTTVTSAIGGRDFTTPTLTTTVLSGSYLVELQVDGTDSTGAAFRRMTKTAFQVYEFSAADLLKDYASYGPVDTDRDGMPDRYEVLYSCLDPKVAQSAAHDADRDGLPTLDEWARHGTNPCESDTDGGGDSDGSETGPTRNAFDPGDDKLTRPIDVEVVNWVADHMPDPPVASNANLIRYPAHPDYRSIRMFRTDSAAPGVLTTIVFSPTQYRGIYTDTGLVNGRIYTYVLQGVGAGGVASALSPVFVGVPKADPLPPRGSVTIAGNKPQIGSSVVRVTLDADPDATQFRLSNDINFTGAAWRSFTRTAPYTLTLHLTHTLAPVDGVAEVYAQYRDASGNVSEEYSDDVVIQPSTSFGVIRGTLRVLTPTLRDMDSAPEPVARLEIGELEVVAPESIAPESVAPESVAPELVAPESVAPELVAPESVAPEAVLRGENRAKTPAGALVWCANLPNLPPTLARADGAFQLTDLPGGRCVLRVVQEGYRPRTLFVDVVANKVVTVSSGIDLTPRRAGIPSSDAALRSLSIAPGALVRTFVSTTYAYSATTSSSKWVTVTATAHPSATVLFESSGGACTSNVCPIAGATSVFTISVAADDGITDRRYRITLQKIAAAVTLEPIAPSDGLDAIVVDATATVSPTPPSGTAAPTVEATASITPTLEEAMTETPLPVLTITASVTGASTLAPLPSATPLVNALSPVLTATATATPSVSVYFPILQR